MNSNLKQRLMDVNLKHIMLGAIAVFGVTLVLGIRLPPALIVAFVVACPLMLMLMMSGGHGSPENAASRDNENPAPRREVGKHADVP